ALPAMQPPRCDVYLASVGRAFPKGSDPKDMIAAICDQLTSPVLWETTVRTMLAAGIDEFYEVGPMQQLKAMMKRIDASAWGKTVSIDI
ncbi:unnamed protein product, partial [Polarella glacialis]